MNKLNSIFKKVAELEKNANEVKLGMHEVELSLTGDAQKSYEQLKKLYIELKKDSEQYVKLKKAQEDYYEVLKKKFYELKDYTQEAKQIEEKMMTAFRELGLPIKDAWPQWQDFLNLRLALANDIRDREQSYLWKNQ